MDENKKDKTNEQEIKKEKNIDSETNELIINEKNNKEENNKEKIEISNIEELVEKKEIEKTPNFVQKELKQKNSKKRILLTLVVLFCLMILSTIFAILNINNEKIVKGVYIEGIDISNLSKQEAYSILNSRFYEIEKKEINIKSGEYEKTITPEQLEVSININQIVDNAYKIGRSNNILIDNFQILKTNIFKENIENKIQYNEQLLQDVIDSIEKEIPGKVEQYSYEIEAKKLVITSGEPGLKIQEEELKKDIIQKIKKLFGDISQDNIVNIKTINTEPDKIDIQKVYNEIYKEPEDAYIVEKPFQVHVEQEGLDFDISIDEAKKIISENKVKYEIPLKITKPKKTVKDLGDKIFKETLSKYTTVFDSSNTNRSSNIALAAKTINGIVLNPGETFSYNKIIGDTTKEKGYKLGGAYVGGKVVQAYGGGICQVSTTLYNAVLYANLEIVKRYNHSYAVSYVPAGRDATVSYGGKDFKFKNNRKYPVKIVANAKNGSISISIKGIKEEKEYEIELQSKVLSRTPCKVVYEETNTLPEGKQKVIQSGYNGYKSITYKITKLDGKIISKETLSSDTYKPMNKIIQVGKKKVGTNNKVISNSTNKTNNSNGATQNTVQSTVPAPATQNTVAQ